MRELATLFTGTIFMSEKISLSHGGGGRQSHELIQSVFVSHFGTGGPMTDSALLDVTSGTIAFTTDSYVVTPVFFPGGNIGKLAVCGTVNDLAVSGAEPWYIAASFIIEEGFGMDDLRRIVIAMAEEAESAGVRIVTGDTKVVEKGQCDGIFITTTGVGMLDCANKQISSGSLVRSGDRVIINGSSGNHAITILAARRKLSFDTPLISDCASLNRMIKKVLEEAGGVHFMRDLTRGGLAAVLNELAEMTRTGITVDEAAVPVDEPVRGLCEMLGFDPLSLANEGKLIIVASAERADNIVEIMRSDPSGTQAAVIGVITDSRPGRVILEGITGGERFLEMPSGLQLPRIC
jgi:hydrogenase expression/formation protein HypE